MPYTYGPRTPPSGPHPSQETLADWFTPRVKCHVSPADPTAGTFARSRKIEKNDRKDCSYACNMLAFDGVLSFPVAIPDGTTNTIAFAERYFYCLKPPYGINDWTYLYGAEPREAIHTGRSREKPSTAAPAGRRSPTRGGSMFCR